MTDLRAIPAGPPFAEVTAVLPHREPFLFVDEVIELSAQRIVATRLFRPEEAFFRGHFPGRPVVPGVILLEGLAQTMGYHALYLSGATHAFLVGVEAARFRAGVEPGQRVLFEVDLGELRWGLL